MIIKNGYANSKAHIVPNLLITSLLEPEKWSIHALTELKEWIENIPIKVAFMGIAAFEMNEGTWSQNNSFGCR